MVAASFARDGLVESHMDYARGLALHLALRLPRCVDREELESDAYMGLLKAAAGFDPGRGAGFRTYATRRIVGEMVDGLRQRGQLRRRGVRPRVSSLNDVVCDQFDRMVRLEDCVAGNEPAVGYAMELREEAEHAMRAWPERLRRTLCDTHLHSLFHLNGRSLRLQAELL